jgi:DNA topoisomerase-3
MLILTEKPGVAGEFAHVLGCARKDGYYESADTCIVWAVGHLLELLEPGDYRAEWQKWNIADLPMIPEKMLYAPVAKTAAQLQVIKACFDRWGKTGLLLATDAEREGELIGETILQHVGFADYEHARRFWVSEALTPEVIKKGIACAKPLAEYDKYKNEGYARQHADWLVGMNMSRLTALRFNAPVTVGRVQTAVLAAIHAREKAISEFKKEFYCQLALHLKKDAADFTLLLSQEKDGVTSNRFTETDAHLTGALDACKGVASAAVEKVTVAKKETPPPQLYNLTGLQKDASKRFGYSPAATLDIAQKLYETHKCLSYPRTPSKVLGDDNVGLFREKYEALKAAYPEDAAGTDEQYLAGENKRLFNTAELRDHHALIPLAPVPDSAADNEKNVYRLVLERFFVQLKAPYVYESIAVSAMAAGYTFAGTGKRVIAAGWKAGAAKDEDDADEDEEYPELQQGETVPATGTEKLQKETKPKGHFTEAAILQLMENPRDEDSGKLVGLGTPATRASIIKALFERGYIVQEKKNVLITDKGKFLIENMGKNQYLARFTSVRETTEWEEKLAGNPSGFLSEITGYLREAVPAIRDDAALASYERPEKQAVGKCPVCGKAVFEGKSNFYCAGYKDDPKCPFVIWKTSFGAVFSGADAKLLLAGKPTKLKKCVSKAGKEFNAFFVIENGKVEMKFETKK